MGVCVFGANTTAVPCHTYSNPQCFAGPALIPRKARLVEPWRRWECNSWHRKEVLGRAYPSFSWAVLSIDRMEHPSSTQGARRYPRYHSNLFRGQDAWDPHTHVLLPSQSPQPSPSEGRSPFGDCWARACLLIS